MAAARWKCDPKPTVEDAMSTTLDASANIPWWKEPTKDQWNAYIAAWLGWSLDAFDFTIFLLIMVPIAKEFDVPLAAVTAVFTITLWMRLVGATAAGWMADRMGRKAPLMISILWYSICNFIAGFSPTFAFLFFFRALFRIGMRGLLGIGILPALAVVWIRYYVKEPEVWVTNKRIQRETKAEVKAPLFSIFKRGMLLNTLTACLWMGSAFCVYYSIWALFSAYLQKELHWTPLMVAKPLFWANIVVFAGSALWGVVSDHWGRRPGIIVPATIAIFVTPLYLWTLNPTYIIGGFILQGIFGGSIYGQNPSYLAERFPTEVRATASGFVYHQGAIWGGLVAPVLTYFAVQMNLGFAMPMLISATAFLVIVVISVLLGPETKGKRLTADLEIIKGAALPVT